MTLESLEILFQVNCAGALRGMEMLKKELRSLSAETAGVRSAGLALSQGLAGGILSGRSLVLKAASSVAQAAVDRMKEKLKIHSPSRAAWELGEMFTEGFRLGVLSEVDRVRAGTGVAAENALGGVFQRGIAETGNAGMAEKIAEAVGKVKLEAPIYVDGVKLGEAAIRGINAVTRAGGRQLLEI